jgi:hypothetical protein
MMNNDDVFGTNEMYDGIEFLRQEKEREGMEDGNVTSNEPSASVFTTRVMKAMFFVVL